MTLLVYHSGYSSPDPPNFWNFCNSDVKKLTSISITQINFSQIKFYNNPK